MLASAGVLPGAVVGIVAILAAYPVTASVKVYLKYRSRLLSQSLHPPNPGALAQGTQV